MTHKVTVTHSREVKTTSAFKQDMVIEADTSPLTILDGMYRNDGLGEPVVNIPLTAGLDGLRYSDNAAGRTVTDHYGDARDVWADEAAFDGARRVENYLGVAATSVPGAAPAPVPSADFTDGAYWAKNGCVLGANNTFTCTGAIANGNRAELIMTSNAALTDVQNGDVVAVAYDVEQLSLSAPSGDPQEYDMEITGSLSSSYSALTGMERRPLCELGRNTLVFVVYITDSQTGPFTLRTRVRINNVASDTDQFIVHNIHAEIVRRGIGGGTPGDPGAKPADYTQYFPGPAVQIGDSAYIPPIGSPQDDWLVDLFQPWYGEQIVKAPDTDDAYVRQVYDEGYGQWICRNYHSGGTPDAQITTMRAQRVGKHDDTGNSWNISGPGDMPLHYHCKIVIPSGFTATTGNRTIFQVHARDGFGTIDGGPIYGVRRAEDGKVYAKDIAGSDVPAGNPTGNGWENDIGLLQTDTVYEIDLYTQYDGHGQFQTGTLGTVPAYWVIKVGDAAAIEYPIANNPGKPHTQDYFSGGGQMASLYMNALTEGELVEAFQVDYLDFYKEIDNSPVVDWGSLVWQRTYDMAGGPGA